MEGTARDWLQRLHALPRRTRFRIMYVCGGHERVITHAGLRGALPEYIELIPGPGCPVCICPEEDIYTAMQMALHHPVILLSFGALLRVPVNAPRDAPRSLLEARAAGAGVRAIASPKGAGVIAVSTRIHISRSTRSRAAARARCPRAAIAPKWCWAASIPTPAASTARAARRKDRWGRAGSPTKGPVASGGAAAGVRARGHCRHERCAWNAAARAPLSLAWPRARRGLSPVCISTRAALRSDRLGGQPPWHRERACAGCSPRAGCVSAGAARRGPRAGPPALARHMRRAAHGPPRLPPPCVC